MNKNKSTKFIVQFLLITFLWSWLLWTPGILDSYGVNVPEPCLAIGMLAVFGPTASALIVTGINKGKSGIKQILKRGVSFKFNKKWLFPILLLAPASSGISLMIGILVTGDNINLPTLTIIPQIFLMFFIGGPLAEEFGWRGFALDILQSRFGALKASLILGCIWGIWHLPLHFISGSVQEYIPIWSYILIIATSSVLFTWLYNQTGRSIATAMLFHWSVNLGNIIFPYWQVGGKNIASEDLPNLLVPTSGMLIGFGVLLITTIIVYIVNRVSYKSDKQNISLEKTYTF